MSKRFIDTSIFRKGFIRSLEAPYKLLWLYIINECDHSGLWDVEVEVAEARLGLKFKGDIISKFGGKVIPVDGGKKWFIPSFIDFQYGSLKADNRVHASVISSLKKFDLLNTDNSIKVHVSPLQGAIYMDKDKDMDTDKEKEAKPLEVEYSIPISWDRKEFNELLRRFIANRKKKKKPITSDVIAARVQELLDACPNWIDAKKKMTDAVHEGWLKLIYEDKNQTEPTKSKYDAVLHRDTA